MPTIVSLSDLEDALAWVSGPPEFDTDAFVSRTTGKIYLRNMDGPVDDDFPEDIDDGLEYLAVPHKNDLDLGRSLVFRFIDDSAPTLLEQVREYFRRKGAYSRFKDLMHRHQLLESWHEYERLATQEALARWATENGISTTTRSAA